MIDNTNALKSLKKVLNEMDREYCNEKQPYLLATQKQILIMLVEDGGSTYSKTIRRRLYLSMNGGYCCRISGIQIWQAVIP